ncbi:hypothetical protein [Ferruginibacter sp. SUN106]|uniref:hypothetical protein n=1 Tax=Ferruginibacter sp. SUN106 TaxID=2978348 RepID=UPI003D368951
MKHLLFVPFLLLLISCSADAQKPTKENITKAIKSTWEKAASSLEPQKTVTINEIKMGTSSKANYAQELEGVPKGALVTMAKIDFTQNIFYTGETQHTRRIMTAWVYKNAFGEWEVMNTGTVYP